MIKTRIETLTGGEICENCHIVYDNNGAAAVVDPGFPIFPEKKQELKNIKAILLTHGHFDHIDFAQSLRELSGAKIYIHGRDEDFLSDSSLNLGYTVPFSADVILSDGDVINAGELSFEVMHTPGHTAGSCCFICGDCVFTGDTLFAAGIGRTDLPTGNTLKILASLRKLGELCGDFAVYPGHGDNTTLSREKSRNRYLKGY